MGPWGPDGCLRSTDEGPQQEEHPPELRSDFNVHKFITTLKLQSCSDARRPGGCSSAQCRVMHDYRQVIRTFSYNMSLKT